MRSTCGAKVGMVNETAIRRLIGFELTLLDFGTKSIHCSTASLDSGLRKVCRESEVVAIVFDAPGIGILEGEWDTSSKNSSPVGSHWKEATCFTPDLDRIVSFLLALKKKSGCDLLHNTKRFPFWSSDRFLTATISNKT